MREILLFTQSEIVTNQWKKLTNETLVRLSTQQELERLLDVSKCQIILYDKQSLDFDLVSLMAHVKKSENSHLFVLSGRPNFEEGLALLKLKIAGYGNSYMDPKNLKLALDVIESGDVWLYPEFVQKLVKGALQSSTPQVPKVKERDIRLDMLTEKEDEVAHLIAKGMSNKEIAIVLNITERTVKAHLSNIYMKLEIGDRLTLALMLQE